MAGEVSPVPGSMVIGASPVGYHRVFGRRVASDACMRRPAGGACVGVTMCADESRASHRHGNGQGANRAGLACVHVIPSRVLAVPLTAPHGAPKGATGNGHGVRSACRASAMPAAYASLSARLL